MPQRDEERWALEEFRKASSELPGEVQQEAPLPLILSWLGLRAESASR